MYIIYLYSCAKSTKTFYINGGGAIQNDKAGTARSRSQIQLKIYRLAVANRSQARFSAVKWEKHFSTLMC